MMKALLYSGVVRALVMRSIKISLFATAMMGLGEVHAVEGSFLASSQSSVHNQVQSQASLQASVPQETELQMKTRQVESSAKKEYISLAELAAFYKLESAPNAQSAHRFSNGEIDLTIGDDNQSIYIRNQRCLLLRPLILDSNNQFSVSMFDYLNLIDPILRPLYIEKRLEISSIVLDPVGGGYESGLLFPSAYTESQYALVVAHRLADLLRQMGYEVWLTRENNQFVSPQQRANMVNRVENALYIRLQLNQGASFMKGVESYILRPSTASLSRPADDWNDHNAALGMALQSSICSSSSAKDGGLRRVEYSILSSLDCPAVIVSLGYVSNHKEAIELMDNKYLDKLIYGIAGGISSFVEALKPERSLYDDAADIDQNGIAQPKKEAVEVIPEDQYAEEVPEDEYAEEVPEDEYAEEVPEDEM